MTPEFRPNLSHVGICCRDVERLARFYGAVFDMRVTDRGRGSAFPYLIVFLSARADQHHQLVLAESRAPDSPSTVMQLAFQVTVLDHLRQASDRALINGATRLRCLSHGNALSLYFQDPEDNTVEVYLDTPWYVSQPHARPFDLAENDDVIWSTVEQTVRADSSFLSVADWSRQGRM
jgi:catechol-2,3-dioxygenase